MNEDCEHVEAPRDFPSPGQLDRAIATIRSNIDDGVLRLDPYWPTDKAVIAQPNFASLGGSPWPDHFTYYLRCTQCAALFVLSAETYHGLGGKWRRVHEA